MALSIHYFGQDLEADPIAAHGLGILCRGKLGSIMIHEHNAKDKEQFWRIWEELGGRQQGIYADGKAFVPPFTAREEPEQAKQPGWFGGLLVAFLRLLSWPS